MKWRAGERVFIKLESSVRPVLRAYVRILFTSGPKVALYIQILSSGQSKKLRTSGTLERTSALKNKSVRPPTPAYA